MPNSDVVLNLTSNGCRPVSVNYAKKNIPFTIVISFEDTNKSFTLSGSIYSSVVK